MVEDVTFNSKARELLALTKNRSVTPAISYDEKSNTVFFTDINKNPIGLDDYVTFVKGVDENGNFLAPLDSRPMTVREYMDYQEQSFGFAQTYVKSYIDTTYSAIAVKSEELKLAEAEVAKYKELAEASKGVDLHFNNQKLKDAWDKRNEVLESSLPIPSAEQLQEMMEVAERSDNLIDSISLRKTDLRNWDNLSQEVKDYYLAKNGDFSTKNGREEGIKTAAEQIMNTMSATRDKLEELEGKAPLVVLSDEELRDRNVGFALEYAGKALTSAASFAAGYALSTAAKAATTASLASTLAYSPLVKLPLSTKIGIGGTGFVVDAAAGLGVEYGAAFVYDKASLEPKMKMAIESGVLTEETLELARQSLIDKSQREFLGFVRGLDGAGIRLPVLDQIKVGDMSKVAALYFGDVEMSGEYIPSKGTNFGQMSGKVEGNEDIAARQAQLGVMRQTLDARFAEYQTETESKRQEGINPLEITQADNALAGKNKGEEYVR